MSLLLRLASQGVEDGAMQLNIGAAIFAGAVYILTGALRSTFSVRRNVAGLTYQTSYRPQIQGLCTVLQYFQNCIGATSGLETPTSQRMVW